MMAEPRQNDLVTLTISYPERTLPVLTNRDLLHIFPLDNEASGPFQIG
jgi:hypothetical protein